MGAVSIELPLEVGAYAGYAAGKRMGTLSGSANPRAGYSPRVIMRRTWGGNVLKARLELYWSRISPSLGAIGDLL